MQEFTEKDCMQTEKEASIQNRVVVLPSKVLPEHYTGQLFFCTNIQKTENPRHSIAHLVSLSTGEAWHCWNRDVVGVLLPELLGKRNGSSSPRSVHLGRWIYMDIPQNILDTVFCRMDAMRQGYGWQIQRKYGAM